MPVEYEGTFSLNGVVSDYCVEVAGGNTVAVLARIKVRPTSSRAGPPACGNGFETAYLAFAKGHVIALELGGSDKPANVVPQFEHWQGKQNGAWRMMEMDFVKHAGKLMLVEIGYVRTGGVQAYQTMLDAFQADRLIDWTDSRIPSSFVATVWPADGVNLSAITSDLQFDTAVMLLKTKTKIDEKSFDLGTALPEPDRSMYVVQSAITIAHELEADYSTPAADADDDWEPPMSPISYLMEEDTLPEIRKRLRDVPSVTPTEAAGFQLAPMIFAMHQTTRPKLRKKLRDRTKQGFKMVNVSVLDDPPGKKAKK